MKSKKEPFNKGKVKINRMDVKEFAEFGFLQEVNRQFFHPLGLALEVEIHKGDKYKLGGIWDYRTDAEGIAFGGSLKVDRRKAERVMGLREAKAVTRRKILGFVIQPIPGKIK